MFQNVYKFLGLFAVVMLTLLSLGACGKDYPPAIEKACNQACTDGCTESFDYETSIFRADKQSYIKDCKSGCNSGCKSTFFEEFPDYDPSIIQGEAKKVCESGCKDGCDKSCRADIDDAAQIPICIHTCLPGCTYTCAKEFAKQQQK